MISYSQEYKIQFSHIPIGQGMATRDSVKIVNSIGGVISKDVSSDSFSVDVIDDFRKAKAYLKKDKIKKKYKI